ncbi:MAG: hypothetical protein IPP06_15885 [Saprospiraceae bacterium]|nr:hypothetical protein [Candidatus Vicinibacter affinis]
MPFFSKSLKTNSKGLTPVYLRITIQGKRLELSTQQFVALEKWNPVSGTMKGFSAEAIKVNNQLRAFR